MSNADDAPTTPADVARMFREAAERLSHTRHCSHECASGREMEEDREEFLRDAEDELAPLRDGYAALTERLRWRDVKTEPLPRDPDQRIETVWSDADGHERREISVVGWTRQWRREVRFWRPVLPGPLPPTEDHR